MIENVDLIKIRIGNFILISKNDAISNILRVSGTWDDHILAIAKLFYENVERPLVIDIGANLGAFCVPVAVDLAKIGGEVIAFEPQQNIYYQLCGNIIINNLDNVTAVQSAIGSAEGIIEIPKILTNESSIIGAFSLSPIYRNCQNQGNSFESKLSNVTIITLDSLLLNDAPCFIKIDVEGYELDVLKGAVEFLSKFNYPPFVFEAWEAEWFKNDKIKLMKFIEDLGYQISWIYREDYLAQHPNWRTKIIINHNNDSGLSFVRAG